MTCETKTTSNLCIIETTNNISCPCTQIAIQTLRSDEISDFIIKDKIFEYFPVNLHEQLPQLSGISIIRCNLKEITKKNFETHQKLVNLDLTGNQLTLLRKDLFEGNQKLEKIVLNLNKIILIYPTIFDKLESLSHLEVLWNICVSSAAESSDEVSGVIKIVQSDCSSSGLIALEIFDEMEKKFEVLKSDLMVTENRKNKELRNQAIAAGIVGLVIIIIFHISIILRVNSWKKIKNNERTTNQPDDIDHHESGTLYENVESLYDGLQIYEEIEDRPSRRQTIFGTLYSQVRKVRSTNVIGSGGQYEVMRQTVEFQSLPTIVVSEIYENGVEARGVAEMGYADMRKSRGVEDE
jgi:hypothetical protein